MDRIEITSESGVSQPVFHHGLLEPRLVSQHPLPLLSNGLAVSPADQSVICSTGQIVNSRALYCEPQSLPAASFGVQTHSIQVLSSSYDASSIRDDRSCVTGTASASMASCAKRFRAVSVEELDNASLKRRNPNTHRATMTGVRAFEEFLFNEKGMECTNWEELAANPDTLVRYILEFGVRIQTRKRNGDYADPKGTTLISYLEAVYRHLREGLSEGHRYDIKRDPVRWPQVKVMTDNRSTEVLSNPANCVENAVAFTHEQLMEIYDSFDRTTPQGHLDSLVLICWCLFGERGGAELHDLKLGWFHLSFIEKRNAIIFRRPPASSKNGTYGARAANEPPREIAVVDNSETESDPNYNPYMILREYILIGHPTKNPNDWFFYNVNVNGKSIETFYKNQRKGVHGFAGFAKRIYREAFGEEPPRNLRNHSFRAFMISELLNSGESEIMVMKRSGHRSTKGIQSYNSCSKRLATASRQQAIVTPTGARQPVPLVSEPQTASPDLRPPLGLRGFNITVNSGNVNIYLNGPVESESEKKL